MPDRQEPQPEDDSIVQSVRAARERAQQKRQEGEEDASAAEELSDEEIEALAKKKEQVAQLLSRGIINNQLDPQKHLDGDYREDMRYEWVRETDADIDRMRALGYELVTRDSEDDDPETPTPDQTRIRYGDVVLMQIPKSEYEIIQEVKDERKAQKQDLGKREYLRRAEESPAGVVNPQGIEA